MSHTTQQAPSEKHVPLYQGHSCGTERTLSEGGAALQQWPESCCTRQPWYTAFKHRTPIKLSLESLCIMCFPIPVLRNPALWTVLFIFSKLYSVPTTAANWTAHSQDQASTPVCQEELPAFQCMEEDGRPWICKPAAQRGYRSSHLPCASPFCTAPTHPRLTALTKTCKTYFFSPTPHQYPCLQVSLLFLPYSLLPLCGTEETGLAHAEQTPTTALHPCPLCGLRRSSEAPGSLKGSPQDSAAPAAAPPPAGWCHNLTFS